MGFEEHLQGVGDGGGFGDKIGFAHQLFDQNLVLVVGLGLEQVPPADEADDVVEILAVDRHAAEGEGGIFLEDLGHGGVPAQGGDHGAGRHDRAHPDVIEREGVGDDVRFAPGEDSVLRAALGEKEGGFPRPGEP